MKKNLIPVKRENSKQKIILKQTPNTKPLIKQNPNLLINDDYLKNFINFDIKIQSEDQKKTLKQEKPLEVREDIITTQIKTIRKIFSETEIKIQKMKEEFDKINFLDQKENSEKVLQKSKNSYNVSINEVNILKSELVHLKMKLEIANMKSKFSENIFYTVKNCLENYKTSFEEKSKSNSKSNSDSNPKPEFPENDSVAYVLIKKLDEICIQNNKYYYESFNQTYLKEHENISPENVDGKINSTNPNQKSQILEIEKNLHLLMNKMNSTLQSELKFNKNSVDKEIESWHIFHYENIHNIRDSIAITLKKILSLYVLNEDLTAEFTQRSKFSIENSQKFVNFEVKERNEKVLIDFEKFLCLNMNKVMGIKIKKDLLEKIKNLNNFHDNFYILSRIENLNLKSNTEIYASNANSKISNIKKMIESFLNFSEHSFVKLKDIMELLLSKNIKQVDKLIHAFLMKEENVFVDLLEKFENLKKSYHLIK